MISMTAPHGFRESQATLKRTAQFSGVGLHTGRTTNVTIHPAPADTGIRFRRSKGRGQGAELTADWRHCIDFPRCTMMKASDGAKFQTIEHLMASFFALEIDNAIVEMDAQEVPIMDGSARPIVEALEGGGIQEQDRPRHFRKISKSITLTDDRISLTIEPHPTFAIDYSLELPYWNTQRWSGEMPPARFREEICFARTYGILSVIWPALILGKLRLVRWYTRACRSWLLGAALTALHRALLRLYQALRGEPAFAPVLRPPSPGGAEGGEGGGGCPFQVAAPEG